MIFLKHLLEADSKKSRGIEEPNQKASKPNKAITKPPKPALAKKEPEPKPATMTAQQAGGGTKKTAGTSDIQKVNGHKDLVAPVKNSAEREANAMGGTDAGQPGPQNPHTLDPAAHLVGRPVDARQLAKVIPPQLDRHGFLKTLVPGEIVQLCGMKELAEFINHPEAVEPPEEMEMTPPPVAEAYEIIDIEKPVERAVVVPFNELEQVMKAFHIGKNIILPDDTQFSTERTVQFPWGNMNDTALVIIRLAPNAEGKIAAVQDSEGLVNRPAGPETRCTNVSKLICPRQSQNTLYCVYVVDLEERMDEDGPLPPIKEDRGEIENDKKIKNPIFDKYMNTPLRQPVKSSKLKDVLPKNLPDENL